MQRSPRGPRGQRNDRTRKTRQITRFPEQNRCRFCRARIPEIDYKDLATLAKLTTGQGKIYSRKRSGNCSRHQQSAKTALKLARFMALMPYID